MTDSNFTSDRQLLDFLVGMHTFHRSECSPGLNRMSNGIHETSKIGKRA